MSTGVKKVSFSKEKGLDFFAELRRRVNSYFEVNQISPKANASMYIKSLFYMGFVGVIYTVLLSGVLGNAAVIPIYALLGVVIALGTMNIAHDALHGAYVTKSGLNRVLGFVMDLCGAISFYWKQEHTIEHHTFTNIDQHDSDLNAAVQLRLCPSAPYHSYHRFQHLYAPFLYSLNLLHWVFVSDMKRMINIIRNKHEGNKKPSAKEIMNIFPLKLLHLFAFVILPMIVLPVAWWVVILGYIAYLLAAGLMITTIFQLAHIVEDVAFPMPNEEGIIEDSFALHQLATTCNFATQSRLVNFLIGGLNFQVEHHLFPHICHIHLSKIAPIVKSTAAEYGIPYHENPTFFGALKSHFKTLKRFGQAPH